MFLIWKFCELKKKVVRDNFSFFVNKSWLNDLYTDDSINTLLGVYIWKSTRNVNDQLVLELFTSFNSSLVSFAPLTIFLSFISVQFPARGLPSDILILLWCSRQCRLYLPSVEVCHRSSNGQNMQLSSMYKWKSSWKCHHHIFDKLLRNCRPLISDWFWNRPDMRSSFNQLLAALASFDLLYLFTMLLEGVSSSFSFLYFERMSKMKKTYSCKRNIWIVLSCIFFVCHHYFTCRPWSVVYLLKLSC